MIQILMTSNINKMSFETLHQTLWRDKMNRITYNITAPIIRVKHGNNIFKIVTDQELENDEFRLDALNSIRTAIKDKTHRKCIDYFCDAYRDLSGVLINQNGDKASLRLEPLWDTPDE